MEPQCFLLVLPLQGYPIVFGKCEIFYRNLYRKLFFYDYQAEDLKLHHSLFNYLHYKMSVTS